MKEIAYKLAKLGVGIPKIYLPAKEVDYTKWAVVACDQYSSEREYWEDVKDFTGSAPSTLSMVFPECYLEDADKAERVSKIQASMHNALTEKLLQELEPGFILVERYTPFEKHPRKGLIIAVDLEAYRYGKDVTSLIRPTEGTIVERLPPRMEIRRGAPLELPHIMLLVDDPERSIIEPLYAKMNELKELYNFELMMGAGKVRGAFVSSEKDIALIAKALEKIADVNAYKAKYGNSDVLLFAVGDGNHSLATAKATWEETKKTLSQKDLLDHPARFALVELVNIYDEGLPFHPIHRVLFKADEKALLADLKAAGAQYEPMSWEAALAKTDESTEEHRFAFISASQSGLVRFKNPVAKLAAGTIQEILDRHLKTHNNTVIDYIHGTESLAMLAKKPDNLGLYLPPIDKASFFATVIKNGAMPRKTFSMGEAPEKRFYIESRKIVK